MNNAGLKTRSPAVARIADRMVVSDLQDHPRSSYLKGRMPFSISD